MANRNFASSRVYSGHIKAVALQAEFTVAPANGLGITGLKGAYIQNVFMHTSTTPAAGNVNPASPNVAVVNPNPASGTIIIQLQDNYSQLYATSFSAVEINGTPAKVDNSALTIGVAYTISTLGDSTAAQWHLLGVPAGITPAVGVSFIALLTGSAGQANTSTSRVAPSATTSVLCQINGMGLPGLLLSPAPSANQGYGSQIILQCRDYAGAIVAPTTGMIIKISMLLGDSSVTVGGN